ncbi:hypothetical protein D6D12_01376 [Aureobasidium pullulans]|uniref:Secreted protein n=1 Tax=Aureobasidium pullulans TaxID=5580 RepID=A0AB74K5I0_AURPU|nr:hypothetical protein D6D12_01376 [Aureobasidium pullulans]
MSMRFQVWISSVPSLASAPTHEDCFSTHHLTQDSTNAAWGLAFLYVWPCRVKRPLWSCISPRESPITGGVVLKG